MISIELTRQNIAKYCANILYGNHTRNQPVSIQISHTLACIPFFSEEDRINLASWTCQFLAPLLGKNYALLDVTVVIEDETHLRVVGEVERR